MSDSLKEKAGSSLFWNFIEKGGQQIIQLVFWYVLIRLLTPEDFGLVALLSIFSIVAGILQQSGFFSALIRKKDADEKDYSSVFYFNIAISIVLYIAFYFFAPYIALYFDAPILTNLARVIFLSFVFNAFGIVQNVHLHRKMDFRSNAKITFTAGILSGLVAMWMAYSGYGVWSLVIQQVLQAFIRTALLWLFIRWRPSRILDVQRLKSMLPYSINLLFTSVFNQVAAYIYPLVIGKYFSITQVGFYSQAFKLNSIPQAIIGDSLQSMSYPLLTKVDEKERIKRVFRKIVRVSGFVCFPVAALIIITAKPVVEIFLTELYIQSIPILQILAVSGAVYPLYSLTASLLQALGKSGLILKIETTRNLLLILSILILAQFGILAMVAGFSLVYVIAFFIAFYFSGKCISYRIIDVLKDILPYIVISTLIFVPVYFLSYIIKNNILLLTIQVITGGGLYLIAIKLLGSKVMADCLEFVKNKKI